MCKHIHGVQYNENDYISVINKVEQCCAEIGVKFDMNEIDRVHYIGKPVFDTDSKQKVRLNIVTFKSWEGTYEADSIIIAYFCFKLIGSRGIIKTNILEVDKVLPEYL